MPIWKISKLNIWTCLKGKKCKKILFFVFLIFATCGTIFTDYNIIYRCYFSTYPGIYDLNAVLKFALIENIVPLQDFSKMINILSKSYHIYILYVTISMFCLKFVFYFALKSVYKPVFYEYKTLPPYVKKIPLNMISRFFQNKNFKLDQKTKKQNKKKNNRYK